jgi:hypothetical protein
VLVRKMRPRFRLSVPIGAEQVVARLERELREPGCPCRGTVAEGHRVIELRPPESERHFWSPTLSVTVAEEPEGKGSLVHGLVGPNANLWTLFAMSYMGLLTLLVFVGTLGLVQWGLSMRPWGLYAVPLLLLALMAMYGLSLLGQRLAAPQTDALRAFLEGALEREERSRGGGLS